MASVIFDHVKIGEFSPDLLTKMSTFETTRHMEELALGD